MTRRPARRGLISLASVFVILAVVLLLVVVCNAASLTTRKVAVRNAADAGAAAAAAEAARGMNQLTATQHVVGELLATAVLAHTPGGAELDAATGDRFDGAAQAELDSAYVAAVGGSPPDAVLYRKTRRPASEFGAAIGSARAQLRGLLAGLYRQRAVGTVTTADATRLEAAVAAEWALLDRMEASARAHLVPLRRLAEFTLVPALADHARRIVEQTPGRVEAAASDAVEKRGATGSLFPSTTGRGRRLELPVVAQTPDRVAAAGGWEVSQAVRAATPWVQFWRRPVLAFADRHLPLSGYAGFYLDFSNRFTLEAARQQAAEFGNHLFVLKDGTAKGREA